MPIELTEQEVWAMRRLCEERNRQTLQYFAQNHRQVGVRAEPEVRAAAIGYRGRQVCELLQNGLDEGLEFERGPRVEVRLCGEWLYAANDGNPLTQDGIETILQGTHSNKAGLQIGRFGVGFQSLAALADRVVFSSGGLTLSFDAARSAEAIREAIAGRNDIHPQAQGVFPMFALAWMDEAVDDAVLEELRVWATTVVSIHLKNGMPGEVERQLRAIDSRFLLFIPCAEARVTLSADGTPTHWRRELARTGAPATGVVRVTDGAREERHFVHKDSFELPPELAGRHDLGLVQAELRRPQPVAWAAPLDEAAPRAGEFWFVFPLQDERAPVPGIVNACWATDTGRTTILRGAFNEWLVEKAAEVAAAGLVGLAMECNEVADGRQPDRARVLDYWPQFPETPRWAESRFAGHAVRHLLEHCCVGDMNGEMSSLLELEPFPVALRPAGGFRALIASILREWVALQPQDRRMPRAGRWPHLDVIREGRYRCFERPTGAGRRDNPATLAEWFAAVSEATPARSAALIHLASLVAKIRDEGGEDFAQELKGLPVVLNDLGELAPPNGVYLPQGAFAEGGGACLPVIDGRRAVHVALNHEARAVLAAAPFNVRTQQMGVTEEAVLDRLRRAINRAVGHEERGGPLAVLQAVENVDVAVAACVAWTREVCGGQGQVVAPRVGQEDWPPLFLRNGAGDLTSFRELLPPSAFTRAGVTPPERCTALACPAECRVDHRVIEAIYEPFARAWLATSREVMGAQRVESPIATAYVIVCHGEAGAARRLVLNDAGKEFSAFAVEVGGAVRQIITSAEFTIDAQRARGEGARRGFRVGISFREPALNFASLMSHGEDAVQVTATTCALEWIRHMGARRVRAEGFAMQTLRHAVENPLYPDAYAWTPVYLALFTRGKIRSAVRSVDGQGRVVEQAPHTLRIQAILELRVAGLLPAGAVQAIVEERVAAGTLSEALAVADWSRFRLTEDELRWMFEMAPRFGRPTREGFYIMAVSTQVVPDGVRFFLGGEPGGGCLLQDLRVTDTQPEFDAIGEAPRLLLASREAVERAVRQGARPAAWWIAPLRDAEAVRVRLSELWPDFVDVEGVDEQLAGLEATVVGPGAGAPPREVVAVVHGGTKRVLISAAMREALETGADDGQAARDLLLELRAAGLLGPNARDAQAQGLERDGAGGEVARLARLREIRETDDWAAKLAVLMRGRRECLNRLLGEFDENRWDVGERMAAALLVGGHGLDVFGLEDVRRAADVLGVTTPRRWGDNQGTRAYLSELGVESGLLARRRKAPDVEVIESVEPLPDLRPYQERLRHALKQVLCGNRGGVTRAMLCLPTGAGKTRVAMESIVGFLSEQDSARVLWVAQSEELLEQAIACLRDVWRHSGERRRPLRVVRLWDGRAPVFGRPEGVEVVVASIQTLANRIGELRERLTDVSAIFIDEAHHAIAPSYTAVLNWLAPEAGGGNLLRTPVVGLSATPMRGGDGMNDETQRLVRRFDGMLLPPPRAVDAADEDATYAALTKAGVLAKREMVPLDPGYAIEFDLTEAQREHVKQFHEIPDEALETLGRQADYVTYIATTVMRVLDGAPDARILVFCCSVRQARHVALRIEHLRLAHAPNANACCGVIDGTTPRHERSRRIRDFDHGRLRVLTARDVLTTGFDSPLVTHVVIARPTCSVVRYLQMIGRGLRGPASGGTETCHILNTIPNLERWGLDVPYEAALRAWEQH